MEKHSEPNRRKSRIWGAVGDMRGRVVVALVCVVAVAAAAMAASFVRVSDKQLQAIESAQAAGEAAMLRGMLGSQQAALLSLLVPMAHWDAIYEYLEAKDPNGFMWSLFSHGWAFLETNNLEAVLFVLPNGTMLNGLMWGPDRTSKVRASETLRRQVVDQLLNKGSASGIFWIPETSIPVIVASEYARRIFLASSDVGWIVYGRNMQSLLRPVAETSNICLSFLTNTTECRAIESIWKGTPVKAGEQYHEDTVNHMVATASKRSCAHVTCSSAANQTHGTYLATGVVFSDEMGVPRVSAVIRGIRFDAATIGTYMRYILAICCSALIAIFLLVYMLVELSVLRILSSLSRKIIAASNGTEFIMQNIYPEDVLRRLRSSVLDAKVVTRYLNGLYSRMDDIVFESKASKVMTIGDAYVTLSQKIQEMANPGDIFCCSTTKDVLEAHEKGHYVFDSVAETEGKAMHVWKLSSTSSESSNSDTESKRSLSTTGLLSVMVDDMSINLSADDDESLLRRVLRSLRLGAVAGMAVLLAASIAAFAVFLLTMLDASSRESIKHRAVADGTRFSNVLDESDPVDYIKAGNPNGKFWQDWFADGTIFNKKGLDGSLYYLPNGTLFNSLGFNYATSSPVSEVIASIEGLQRTIGALADCTSIPILKPNIGFKAVKKFYDAHHGLYAAKVEVVVQAVPSYKVLFWSDLHDGGEADITMQMMPL
eukprot:m51a1_g10788 hypothetical protein (711) ;mRNA; r:486-12155